MSPICRQCACQERVQVGFISHDITSYIVMPSKQSPSAGIATTIPHKSCDENSLPPPPIACCRAHLRSESVTPQQWSEFMASWKGYLSMLLPPDIAVASGSKQVWGRGSSGPNRSFSCMVCLALSNHTMHAPPRGGLLCPCSPCLSPLSLISHMPVLHSGGRPGAGSSLAAPNSCIPRRPAFS